MASWHATLGTLLLRRRSPEACGNRTGTKRRSRAVCRSNVRSPTRRRSGGDASPIWWSCRLSASTVLELFQPAAGCWALETVLAMAQPVRVHDSTCSHCAAALLRINGPRLEVCRTPRRSPPAMHRSQCSDRVSCARAAGSCSVSSSIIGLTVSDRRRVLGERAALSMLTQPSSQSGDGAQWLAMCARRRAAARQLRGSLTHVTGLHGRACEGAVSHKISNVVVSRCGVVGAARLRRIPGQQCGRTSKVERCELTVVVISHILTHKTLGCGGATRWGRGRDPDRPFRH